MSTRSDIIVHHADGSWKRVYCHFDGYIDGVGKRLFNYYSDQQKAEALVSPGDMSSLGKSCDRPPGHSFENPVEGYTVYYGRDRGENDVAGFAGASLKEVWPSKDTWTEFTYVFDDGKWWVGDPDVPENGLIDLGDCLSGKKTIHPFIKAFGMTFGRHA